MFKSYRTILSVLLIVLVAGAAFAEKPATSVPHFTLTEVDAIDSPTNRDMYVLTYDFAAGPVDYDVNGIQFGSEGILPAGTAMVAFGFENIMADVYHNDGASYSNWASEAWLGCTYDDAGVLSFVGTSPFTENEGPGVFGPSTVHFDLNPADWPLPTAEDFTFYASSSYDDGSGLAAGTFTSGVIYVWVESSVIATDDVTMSGVKALFR
jgi:hypothetical protein